MKLISPKLEGNSDVWLLTNDMVNAIDSSGIGFDNLYQLPLYQDRIAESDIISFAVLQYSMGLKLGKQNMDVFDPMSYKGAEGGVIKTRIEQVCNEIPRLAAIGAINATTKYLKRDTKNGVILCQGNLDTKDLLWSDTGETSFSYALLKGIYDRFGYHQLHFNSKSSSLPGGFTLGDVLRILV